MATQSPFNESNVSDNANVEVKTFNKLICWVVIFVSIGQCIYRGVRSSWSMTTEYKVGVAVSVLIVFICLLALYGIHDVQPGCLIPLMVVYSGLTFLVSLVVFILIGFCILNVAHFFDQAFRTHQKFNFHKEGSVMYLVFYLFVLFGCCFVLYSLHRCYEYLRAEKKAAENLASDQNVGIRDYHSAESGAKLITISEL